MSYINQQKYGAAGQVVDIHDKRIEDSFDGILKSDGNGNISVAIRGTDYDTSALPSQTGQSGKFLTTDGTDASWANIDALPSQTGESGKFLTTDGSSASWANVDALPDQTGQSGKFLTTNGTAASWADIPLFCVTYETTPYATIKAAHDAGYLCYMINGALIYMLIQANSEVCAFTLTGESAGFSTVNIIRVTSSDVWSSTWLDAQSKVTASGILKGDGAGTITAATAGTDYLTNSGFTMNGEIKTSFGAAVAMGTRGSAQNTIPNLVNELRYSSGVGGSFSLGTAYTLDGVTMSTGWYNYLWIPHRSGGVNGQASGDNCDYGMLLMNAMTGSYGCFMLRYTSGTIAELKQLDAGGLPSQSGNSGKFLTTNGTTLSWVSLPVYTGAVI